MRKFLASPRRRRRALRLGTAGLVVVGAVVVGITWSNTGERREAPITKAPIQAYKEPQPVRLTRNDRRLALKTAMSFVNTAVARQHLEDSWALAAPSLKEGMSRTQWQRGEIPVVPYPAAEARVKVDYTYRNTVGLRLLLFPPAQSELSPQSFDMDLKAVGAGSNRHWLVASWTPSGVSSGQVAPQQGDGGGLGQSLAPQPTEGLDAPLGAGWIVLPLALLGMVVLVPIGLGIRSWLQGRRAEREYHRSRRENLAGEPPAS